MMFTDVPRNAIVAGVDGSPESWHALRWAADRADATAQPLHILHAKGIAPIGWGRTVQDASIDNVCEQALGVVAHHASLRVSWSQPRQPAVSALLEASTRAAQLVIGTRGAGAVRGAVLGSVTTELAATADCPVTVVRAALTDRQRVGPVVVGVDDRPDGAAALQFAFAEAERRHVTLRATLCWRPDKWRFTQGVPMTVMNTLAARRHQLDVLRRALAAPAAQHPHVYVETVLATAPATAALTESSADASLLVVGTRGRHGMGGLLLGSVSQGVMRRAHCPVAIVRPLPAEALPAGRNRQMTV
ncbi:universal stress protein [Flexivirga oryzae]|uniref:Nucleotide-binding universal stress UspA family protein n=1 Tax=Flexivirga oryzae TaxID=1794944 RepID=A0A839N5C0_9MICO|nr:universal stress protein [Flexivirga oryzae]MBB2892487.1 nucleotide-binding universal stress UspA family protein [Flexivirga oryzae]